MTIINATPAHAADIAQLIMTAMTEDCCQFLAGKDHTLDDFYRRVSRISWTWHCQATTQALHRSCSKYLVASSPACG